MRPLTYVYECQLCQARKSLESLIPLTIKPDCDLCFGQMRQVEVRGWDEPKTSP